MHGLVFRQKAWEAPFSKFMLGFPSMENEYEKVIIGEKYTYESSQPQVENQ